MYHHSNKSGNIVQKIVIVRKRYSSPVVLLENIWPPDVQVLNNAPVEASNMEISLQDSGAQSGTSARHVTAAAVIRP
jgi:hypothetical protein